MSSKEGLGQQLVNKRPNVYSLKMISLPFDSILYDRAKFKIKIQNRVTI